MIANLRAVAAVSLLAVACSPTSTAGDANRLTYLDAFCDPYYVDLEFPKLTTPQWVGESGVEAVITLGIDDMRDVNHYEGYLRPILDRLKEIDGRAPVSIMTNQVDPNHQHLQTWLQEGLSLETHTADHPCPCLFGGDFEKARSTYDRCVDQLAAIPGSHPVAFRFPCMDSLNTPSPRAFAEILNRTTAAGNFLQLSTSVCSLLTPDDPDLPKEIVYDPDGGDRFGKYVPFQWFVNEVRNYPYPFVVGKLIWEFGCAIPDDWQGQALHRPLNPKTVEDYRAVVDAVVIKRGTANFVFHPYAWIRSDQMIEVIDHAVSKYGNRIKFLNFRECATRLNQHLLLGQPLRAANGQDNGVRLLDVNDDGFLDVVIGNERLRKTRIWQPDTQSWRDIDFPVQIVDVAADGERSDAGVRFGVLERSGNASFVVGSERQRGVWHFRDGAWFRDQPMSAGFDAARDGAALQTVVDGRDQGVRLRDIDYDGICELLAGGPERQAIFAWDGQRWKLTLAKLPEQIVDAQGRDAGLRFVDLDQDSHDDLIFSDEQRFSVYRFVSRENATDQSWGWSQLLRAGKRGDEDAVPMIVRSGTNNGAWFAERHMWLQNEDTDRLPDGVDRRSFAELLGDTPPGPRDPQSSLRSMQPRPGFSVELVAAEPLVMDPVSFDWGDDGRLWVVEMADYPLGMDDAGEPGGRVRFLQDSDGDGKYDKSTLFLEGLPFPTSVMAWRDGVLITAAPDVIFAADRDGDGRADHRESLFTGFGEGNQQHRVNGLRWGLDNWIYLANGDSGGKIRSAKTGGEWEIGGRDLRIRPSTGELDPQSGQSQYGRNRDDWGNWFGCNNSLPLAHYVLADHYLRRNPHFKPPAARNNIARTDNTQLFPIARILSHYSNYQPPQPGQPHRFTSACSTSVYRDTLFGTEFDQNTFTSAPIHNLVHRRILEPTGISFGSRRAADETSREFLASTDSWFRPTTVRTGPDGALWVADMYREVMEHPEWIDDQLEQQLNLRAGHDRGRIYRVFPQQTPPRRVPPLNALLPLELVDLLASPNGWLRDAAQRKLIEIGDKSVRADLEGLAQHPESPLCRLHALCTLDGLDLLTPQTLRRGLEDDHPGVRRHAVRLCEGRSAEHSELGAALFKLVDDQDAHVQLQLAYTLGEWDHPQSGTALGKLARRHAESPQLMAAVISSLRGENLSAVLAGTIGKGEITSPQADLVARLLEVAVRMDQPQGRQVAVDRVLQQPPVNVDRAWQWATLARMLTAAAARQTPLAENDARLASVVEEARQTLVNPAADPKQRVAASRVLGFDASQRGSDVERLSEQLQPQNPLELQSAVVARLSQIDHADVPARLLAQWGSLTPGLRGLVLDALLSRSHWTAALLTEIEAEPKLASRLDAARRERLLKLKDSDLRSRAEKLFTTSSSVDRKEVLAAYRVALSTSGDGDKGERIFAKHCSICHQVGGIGHVVGPDLTALKNNTPEALLTALLDPNRAVEDKFVNYLVTTVDGRSFSGMLANETGTSITLRAQEGKEQVILRQDIDSLDSSGKSLMPEGLERDLTPQQIAHLLAHLSSLGPPPKQFEGNQPQLVQASEADKVELTAANCRIFGETLVFEQRYGNLGFWQSESDRAEWLFEAPGPGRYHVVLDYACDNSTENNPFLLEVGEQVLQGRVPGTGTWDDYRELPAGDLQLEEGVHRLIFRGASAPSNCLIDLRAVRLSRMESAGSE